MDEAISSTPQERCSSSINFYPPQENASSSILQEGDRPPGKDAAACQPEAQNIVLSSVFQPGQPDEQSAGQPSAQHQEQKTD